MDILKIAALGIVSAVLVLTIKKTHPEMAIQLSIAAGIILFLFSLDYLKEVVSFIRDFSDKFSFAYSSILLVIKIIGIAYVCEFSVQILKDAGESSIASKVELAAKLLVVVISLPLLSTFLDLVLGLLK
ncbi:MAG: stage III sporulation protein AD [Eubacteriales bacterium]